MFSRRQEELDKLLTALGERVLDDAPGLIEYLNVRGRWDPSIGRTKKCSEYAGNEDGTFRIASYYKPEFSPFLDQRIEDLANRENKTAILTSGDGDHWVDIPENRKTLKIYKKAVDSGCDITIMLKDLDEWGIVKESAKTLNDIGVKVGNAPSIRKLHGGVIGGNEMYVIHRYPEPNAEKKLYEAQPIGEVNYTMLYTNFEPFVKQGSHVLAAMKNRMIPYEQIQREVESSINSRKSPLASNK